MRSDGRIGHAGMKKIAPSVVLTVCALFLCAGAAVAAGEPSYPARPQGYVSDYAGVLDETTRAKISSLADELERKTGAQLAVVTVKSTAPETIEGYAVALFERWGIGRKGKDNGVLLLVALNERKLRIETGYGIEGMLPDALCDRIIREIMVPYFKRAQYSEGIYSGASAIAYVIAKEHNVAITGISAAGAGAMPRRQTPAQALLRFIFTLIIFSFFLSMRMGLFGLILLGSGRRRGGYWYGGGYGGNSGGFGGGFGGFGGGFSGGGGASGGW